MRRSAPGKPTYAIRPCALIVSVACAEFCGTDNARSYCRGNSAAASLPSRELRNATAASFAGGMQEIADRDSPRREPRS
jgi:hypothetical protein